MKLDEIEWHGINFLIVEENELILSKQYGLDWKTIPQNTQKEEKYINKFHYFLS